MKRTPIIVLLLAVIAVSAVYAYALSRMRVVPSSGVIAHLDFGVYHDAQHTDPAASIDWGVCYLDDPATHTLYVVNEGTVSHTLTAIVDNVVHHPDAALTVTFSSNNVPLAPSAELALTVTLTITSLPDTVDDYTFSLDIVLTADDGTP